MKRFGRNARVTIFESVRESYNTVTRNSLVVEATRIQFSVEKSNGSDPNTCDITLTNLSPESLAFLQRKPLQVWLEAGYDGEYRQVFRGDLHYALPHREGTERDIVLQVADGARAYRHARVNRSYRAGATVRTMLADVASSMGLELPDTLTDAALDTPLPAGDALTGPARDELTRLLAPYGYSWSIQSGTLQVLRDGQVRPGSVLVLDTSDPDAGIIGVPALTAPDKSSAAGAGKPKLSLQCALSPDLFPGIQIAVLSSVIRGRFRVEKVKHTGDTHGSAWTTDIDAKPL